MGIENQFSISIEIEREMARERGAAFILSLSLLIGVDIVSFRFDIATDRKVKRRSRPS